MEVVVLATTRSGSDRPALRPLPESRFVFARWQRARVGVDYHVVVDSHAYSVPHALVRKLVDVRVTDTTVEVLYANRRVASHARSSTPGGHSQRFPVSRAEMMGGDG